MIAWFRHVWWAVLACLGIRPYPLLAERCADVPDEPMPGVVYIVGDSGAEWCVAFLCPCACGKLIMLNLLTSARPCWGFRVHGNGTVSLSPSVWRTVGCCSHFFVRAGRVDWCESVQGRH